MAKYFDTLFTIFPFEAEYFSHTPLDVVYIGNPTKEKVHTHQYHSNWKEELSIPSSTLVALFPGSRKSELSHNLPLHLKVAELLHYYEESYQFAISCTNDHLLETILKNVSSSKLQLDKDIFIIPREYSYDLMKESSFALAKSGTVTLELALHRTPTVVTYEVSKTHQFIVKHLLRLNLPHYCIVNILAKKEVFPEFLGASLPEEKIYNSLLDIYSYNKQNTIESCQQIDQLLSDKKPAINAADYIERLLDQS